MSVNLQRYCCSNDHLSTTTSTSTLASTLGVKLRRDLTVILATTTTTTTTPTATTQATNKYHLHRLPSVSPRIRFTLSQRRRVVRDQRRGVRPKTTELRRNTSTSSHVETDATSCISRTRRQRRQSADRGRQLRRQPSTDNRHVATI